MCHHSQSGSGVRGNVQVLRQSVLANSHTGLILLSLGEHSIIRSKVGVHPISQVYH